jgi:uncharacterized RDD family membrane protein YckC
MELISTENMWLLSKFEKHPRGATRGNIDLIDRGIATFIDYLAIFVVPGVIIDLIVPSQTQADYGALPESPLLPVIAIVGGAVLVTLYAFPYYTIAEGVFGYTIGKWAVGAVVVQKDGSPVTWKAVVIRNLVRVVDYLPAWYILGAVFVGASDENQRIGDIAAETRVAPIIEGE